MINKQEILQFAAPELLIKRFCQEHQVSETEARERFEETKKFLLLCATNKQVSYSPSLEVDALWHEFILCTKSYFDFCNMAGMYIHHEPSEKPETEAYKRTLKDMKNFYGKLNSAYWADGKASAGHCGHSCSSCGSN